jgi:two-component sensor histidine kinase
VGTFPSCSDCWKTSWREALEGRLYSLARTQELLVAGPGDAAQFHELVRLELLSVGATEGVNFNLDGPAITIPSRAAQVLGMVIRETWL